MDYFGARYYDSEIGRWLSIDPLADKYPGWSPYNYCKNNPLNAVDPNGKDVWEKMKNLVTGKGWRDDNMQENYEQGDWKNITPQLAKEQGVPDYVEVVYSDAETVGNTNEAGHSTCVAEDGKTKVIEMTKGGYEKLDESNLNNMRSSVDHEISNAKKSLSVLKSTNVIENAKEEMRAIKDQKNDPTYKSSSETYKKKMIIMKNIKN